MIRERLLEQGYRQFSAYGLKKTNVEELAGAAGISKGAFYLFYESKEALFMDVIEETAEKRFRQEVLAAVDLPGPSPRARLLAVLQKAFAMFKTIPILQFFTGSDYDLLFRRIPPRNSRSTWPATGVLRRADRALPEGGHPHPGAVRGDQRPAVSARSDHPARGRFGPSAASAAAIDMLLELVAAFCLGEVELQAPEPDQSRAPVSERGARP